MTGPFVDTGGWAAWANGRDVHHAAARAAIDAVWRAQGQLMTTNLVLIEPTALFLRMKIDKVRQVEFYRELAADPSVTVVFVTPDREAEAWDLWRSRPDKDWTLVGCASFVVMRHLGLTDALTPDRHFEQAGFVRLLK